MAAFYRLLQNGGAWGLAYDAVHIYALAIRKLIDMNMTVTGPAVAKTIRSVSLCMKLSCCSANFDPVGNFTRLCLSRKEQTLNSSDVREHKFFICSYKVVYKISKKFLKRIWLKVSSNANY